MSKFYVWLEQEEGCDYTIGCGNTLRPLKAKELDDAVAEVKNLLFGDPDSDDEGGYYGDDNEIDRALLIEVQYEEQLPLSGWRKEKKEREAKEEKEEKEKQELAQLARLKNKYEVRDA